MKKILFVTALSAMLLVSPFLSAIPPTGKADAATAEGEKRGKIPLIYKEENTNNKKRTFSSENRVKQHTFTKEDLDKISKLAPNTSVGSDGSIVSIDEQQKVIQREKIQLNGNQGTESVGTSEFAPLAVSDFTRVTDRNSYPYRAIAEIETTWPNGKVSLCTGFFIDADSVATAGHCVYDTYLNVYATEVVVYPFGRADGVGHFSSKFYVSSSWINVTSAKADGTMAQADFAKDYGVIDLYGAPANDYGWGWFAIRDYNHEVGEGINLSGFTADLYGNYSHSYDVLGDGLYKSLGNVTDLDTYLIISSAFCWHGMSGGPSFNTKNGTTAVIGVTNGTSASSINEPESSNYSLSARIIGYTKTNLEYWSGL